MSNQTQLDFVSSERASLVIPEKLTIRTNQTHHLLHNKQIEYPEPFHLVVIRCRRMPPTRATRDCDGRPAQPRRWTGSTYVQNPRLPPLQHCPAYSSASIRASCMDAPAALHMLAPLLICWTSPPSFAIPGVRIPMLISSNHLPLFPKNAHTSAP